jgi:hypothetical protein
MAKNDVLLVDGIVDERIAKGIPSDRRDEAFELFAFEQLLKSADLSLDELKSGWVDGGDDGGIDGFFVFVNDHLVSDVSAFSWPRNKAEVAVWIINCKHHDTFQQAPIDKLIATLGELLDLSLKPVDLESRYSQEVIAARERLVSTYRALATRIAKFDVNVAYASRGDTSSIGAAVAARSQQLSDLIKDLFSNCRVNFSFVGAGELVEMARKAKRFSLKLPYHQMLASGERYVVLARLLDYYHFVTDEDKKMRRYLFDSNVRDFAGLNKVNEEIAKSLTNREGPDFWWMNNGVTILATGAVSTGDAMVLDDVQIVNGLQTQKAYFDTSRQGEMILKVELYS